MFRFNNQVMEEVNVGTNSGGASGSGAPSTGGVADSANITANTGGQPTNDAGANTNGAQGAAAGAEPKSWLESLPDDIKKDPSLALFKEPAALAKSWINAQKLIGADKVIIPGEKATDEERAAFYQKLGRPDAPEKYELKTPEGYKLDDNQSKTFKESAFKLGLTPAQVNGILEFDASRVNQTMEAQETAKRQELETSLINYQKSLGGDDKFKARVDEARFAVQQLASPELKAFLDKSQLGSQPEMIEFFAQLKAMMSDGKVRDGTGVGFGADPSAIQAEIDAIQDPKSPLWDSNHPQRQVYVEKQTKLYERLHAAQNGRTM
jgi:hypothetical protein